MEERKYFKNNSLSANCSNEELDFINHYIYLQKIRFEDSVLFEIKIEESKKSAYLL